jgi:hypothetical protein
LNIKHQTLDLLLSQKATPELLSQKATPELLSQKATPEPAFAEGNA